ncbi:MAG: CsgG/HfaB family protein [Thermodesulfobacteriota bacterium]
MKRSIVLVVPFLLLLFSVGGCMEGMVQPQATVDPGLQAQMAPYHGPRASVAVAKFDWKVGGGSSTSTTTISGMGNRGRGRGHGKPIIITHQQSNYMTGLKDMLTTSLVQSGRYRVLERQEFESLKGEMALAEEGYVEKETAIKKGKVKGAELLVVAAITGWEPDATGMGGGIGGIGGGVLGGVLGGYKKSYMAMDIRIIDAATSEILSATRVEGIAKDVNLGVLLGGVTGNVGLGVGLSSYAKTPMEKAIRTCINEAVKYIVTGTPQSYFKY